MKPVFALFVILPILAVDTLQSRDAPFSSKILNSMPVDDAQALFFSAKYLTFQMRTELSPTALEKAKQLESILGTQVPLGPRPPGISIEEYLKRKQRTLNNKFRDQSMLLGTLSKAAKAYTDPEGKIAAAHILDLVVTIDSTRIEDAYEREKLFVTENISLNWNTEVAMASERKPAPNRAGDDIFEVDFSKLAVRSTGSGAAPIAGLARNQSLIKGLLVQELTGSQFAGEASQMNATVIGNQPGGMRVRFNQRVGPMMTDAVGKMMAYLKERHGRLPGGVQVELSFEEQYVPKDGPSAGVACTLLLDALIKGQEYSTSFAVTGAMDEKGKVGGVGGIDGKIRGAIARNCEIVAIPSENENVIQDMLILEGPATLAKIQILEIETFDQAMKIALEHDAREESIRQAIEEFREIQSVLNRPGGMAYLKNAKVKGKLRSVLQAVPNHLSAKYLLLKGLGREPSGLTLIGSVQAIDRNAAPLLIALREGDFAVEDSLRKDRIGATIGALTRLRPLLDERTRPCGDAIITYSRYIHTAINSPPRSSSAILELKKNIRSSGRAVDDEYDNLYKRADVKKELMIGEDE